MTIVRAALRALPAAAALLAPAWARADAPAQRPLPALTIAADGGVMGRMLRWNDDLFGALRPFTLGAAPILGGEVAVYPGAFFTRGRPGWLGVAARAEGVVGVSTQRAGHADSLPTRAWAFSVSARGRVPFTHGAAWLDAGLAGRGFTVDAAGITAPDVPSVGYLGPRLGLGGEVTLPVGFSMGLNGGVARWVSTGDLGSAAWFPQARAWGADLRLRLAWASRQGLGPYLDFAWSRDLAALRPQPGDARVAGGLADDRFSGRFGLAWTFRGK